MHDPVNDTLAEGEVIPGEEDVAEDDGDSRIWVSVARIDVSSNAASHSSE